MKAKRLHSQGFTLLEVLVAFLVLSTSLTVIMNIFSQSMRNQTVGTEKIEALILAESKMAEFTAGEIIVPGDQAGMSDAGYEWRVQIEPFEFPDQEPLTVYSSTPYRVSVTVFEGGREPAFVTLETVQLVRPEALK